MSTSLPTWADDLRRRYLRGEASIFVLHGNVYDAVLHGDRVMPLTDFLGNVLLKMRDAKGTEIPVSRSQTKRLREYLRL